MSDFRSRLTKAVLPLGIAASIFALQSSCDGDVVEQKRETSERSKPVFDRDAVPRETRQDDTGPVIDESGREVFEIVRPRYQPWVAIDTNGQALPAGADARYGSLSLRHPDRIVGLEYATDGRMLVSGSHDGLLRFWDSTSGDPRHAELDVAEQIADLAVSPNGQFVAAVDGTAELQIWTPAESRLWFRTTTPWGEIRTIDMTDTVVAVGADAGVVGLYDLQTQASLAVLEGHTSVVTDLAFSPDGSRLASLSADGTLRLWSLEDTSAFPLVLEGLPNNGLRRIAWSRTGEMLAISGTSVTLVRAADGTVLFELEGEGDNNFARVVFSTDGKTIISSDASALKLWDSENGTLRGAIQIESGPITALAHAPRSARVAVATERTLHLVDTNSDRQVLSPPGHSADVLAVDVAFGGNTLASASADHTVRVWDRKTGKERSRIDFQYALSDVVLGADGQTVAIASPFDGAFVVRKDGVRMRIHDIGTHRISYVRGGLQLVLSDSHGQLVLVDPFDGKNLGVLPVDRTVPETMVAAPFGALIAVGLRDGGVQVIDLAPPPAPEPDDASPNPDGEDVQPPEPPTGRSFSTNRVDSAPPRPRAIALSADEQWLAILQPASIANTGTLQIWSIASQSMVAEIEVDARRVAFSPDGRALVVGRDDGSMGLLERSPLRERISMFGHRGYINDLAFSNDGKHLVSGSADTTLLWWNVEPLRTYVAPIAPVTADAPAQNPVDKPPVDKPPVDKPPVDKPPVDKTPADKTPADKPPVDKPPVDKPPVDTPPADKTPADKTPADKTPADKTPADKPSDTQPDTPPADKTRDAPDDDTTRDDATRPQEASP